MDLSTNFTELYYQLTSTNLETNIYDLFRILVLLQGVLGFKSGKYVTYITLIISQLKRSMFAAIQICSHWL